MPSTLLNSYARDRSGIRYVYYSEVHGLGLKALIDEMIVSRKDYRLYCKTTRLSLNTLKVYVQQAFFWLVDNCQGDDNAKPYIMWRRSIKFTPISKGEDSHLLIRWRTLNLEKAGVKEVLGIVDLPGREMFNCKSEETSTSWRTNQGKPDNSWKSEVEEFAIGVAREYRKEHLQLTEDDIFGIQQLFVGDDEIEIVTLNQSTIHLKRSSV